MEGLGSTGKLKWQFQGKEFRQSLPNEDLKPGDGTAVQPRTSLAPGLPSFVRCKEVKEDDPNSGA